MSKPTFDRAIALVRTDPDARFAALLAAVFAFSLGFVIGFLIGEVGEDPADTDPSAD